MRTVGVAGRREWWGLTVIALPCLVYAMDLTVLNLAVPALTADLRPTSSQLLWILDVYGFMVAGLLITMGTLGDRIGRRRLLLIGAAAFGACSLLVAFSTTTAMLIAARALLGVAGATLAPSTLSLIRLMFVDTGERTVAIGIWITTFSVGAAIGPLVGGVLLQHFWWGSVFLINLPVMALLLLVGPRLLPEFRDPRGSLPDLASIGMSLVAVLALVYGVKRLAEDGPGALPVTALVLGVLSGVLFLSRQRRLPDPLIDLDLFRARPFSVALAVYTAGFVVNFGLLLFITQYLQLVVGMSPLRAGVWMVPAATGFIVGSLIAPRASRRVRPARLVAGGLGVATLGCSMLVLVDGSSDWPLLVTGSTVLSLGLAVVFTLATDLVVGAASPKRAGAAAAISETGAELGGALGIALLGTVGAAVYRATVSVPSELAADSIETARGTLAGALTASRDLAPELAANLVSSAQSAFLQGMQAAAGMGAALLLVAAALSWFLLGLPGPAAAGKALAEPDLPDAHRPPSKAGR